VLRGEDPYSSRPLSCTECGSFHHPSQLVAYAQRTRHQRCLRYARCNLYHRLAHRRCCETNLIARLWRIKRARWLPASRCKRPSVASMSSETANVLDSQLRNLVSSAYQTCISNSSNPSWALYLPNNTLRYSLADAEPPCQPGVWLRLFTNCVSPKRTLSLESGPAQIEALLLHPPGKRR
jgi:hypothetical protein